MATLNEVASQIISSLRLTDPDLDTSVGTTTRKIIDAVAESVAEAYVDQFLLSYTYDIDAKAEGDLDAFVNLFGIARLSAKRSTGVVTFTRVGDTSNALTIQFNTNVRSNTEPQQDFVLVAPAVFPVGASMATAPIQAVNAGAIGNLAPSTITIGNNLPLNILVTNTIPTADGTEAETDQELRLRWKRTVFRSLAGTEQMYLGVALNDPDVVAANIVTATKTHFEQLQILTGSATSSLVGAQFIYPNGVTVGNDIAIGDVFLKGMDYTWTSTNPPVINVINAVKIPNNTLVEASFQYTPKASRNDPTNGVMHRVDLWVAGVRPKAAVQSVVYASPISFSATTTSPYYNLNFIRTDGTAPTVGNIFIPLNYGPIVSVPTVLTIGGHTYGLVGSGGTTDHPNAYRVVHDDTAFGYSAISLFGLELTSAAAATIAANTAFSIGVSEDYIYNEIPSSNTGCVQAEIDRWRLLGVDVLTHQARTIFLRFNLAIIYSGSIAPATVNQAIDTAVSAFLIGIGFDAVVQYSDILQVVHNVVGVDAVRFLHGGDYPGFPSGGVDTYAVGIQKIVGGTVTHSYVDINGRALDVLFSDTDVAAFETVYKVPKAQNSFGVG